VSEKSLCIRARKVLHCAGSAKMYVYRCVVPFIVDAYMSSNSAVHAGHIHVASINSLSLPL